MPHSKREIGYMKKHMAHVLILEFYEETVYDCKKLMKNLIEGPDGHQEGHLQGPQQDDD